MSGINIDELEEAIGRAKQSLPVRKQAPKPMEESAPAFELDDDGEEYMGIGADGVLASTEKLLAINRGLAEPDERDSLKFQKVLRTHSLFREGIKMDAGKIARTAMYQAAKRGDLGGMGPGVFDGYVNRMLAGNQLTSPLEEINPMQLAENARRITKMGIGGLRSSQSITQDAQAVHPSQFGFIDCVAGPECLVDDNGYKTEVFTKDGWKRLKDIQVTDTVMALSGKEAIMARPDRVVHGLHSGTMYKVKSATNGIEFMVTPGHRIVHNTDKLYDVHTADELYAGDGYLDISTYNVVKDGIVKDGMEYIPEYAGTAYVEKAGWEQEEVDAMPVHCVTVKGGIFMIRVNGGKAFWTGNSERAGIDVRAAWGTKVGSNGRIYQKMFNRRTGKMQWVCSEDLDGHVVKIPD